MRATPPLALLGLLLAGTASAQEPALPRLEHVPCARRPAPVAVVVHGINPLAGQLDPLAADVAARGYDTYQFHYDDHQDLDRSATQLGLAVRRLLAARGRHTPRLLIVAHSMGGLVARRALTRGDPAKLALWGGPTRLVTVASPFHGFASANFAWLDFGLGPPAYDDLGSLSRFIRRPGQLGPRVTHIKVETHEAGHTRREGGQDASDEVVSPRRQRQARVDAAATARYTLDAGHVGSVNTGGRVSCGLKAILDRTIGRPRNVAHSRPLEGVVVTAAPPTRHRAALSPPEGSPFTARGTGRRPDRQGAGGLRAANHHPRRGLRGAVHAH